MSGLRAWLAARNEELASDGELHLGPESSPLSIYSRVKGARAALLGESQKLSRLRASSLQGCVELYWLAKWMDARLEAFWSRLDAEEIRRREELCAQVGQRFLSLVPPSAIAGYERASESPGALAVALAEEQGRNLDLASRAAELAAAMEREAGENLRHEVASCNMEAAGTLAEFEWNVLASAALPVPLARDEWARHDEGTASGGFPALEAARRGALDLARLASEIEGDVGLVKQALRRGIDLLERQGACPEARRLLAEGAHLCAARLGS